MVFLGYGSKLQSPIRGEFEARKSLNAKTIFSYCASACPCSAAVFCRGLNPAEPRLWFFFIICPQIAESAWSNESQQDRYKRKPHAEIKAHAASEKIHSRRANETINETEYSYAEHP